jgi:Ion transport protein
LHYACAFGASEEVLYVLTDAYPEAIHTKDRRQRTPLHFALSNAGRKTVPSAVRLLLSLNNDIVNSIDGGPLPLRVLSEYTATIKTEDDKRDEKRESVQKCLEHILNAQPDPTADFLTTLQSLPDWLSERAVVMPVVQILLNEKISRRFPTVVLMMDFYVIIMTIVSYSYNVVESINRRSSHSSDNDPSIDAIPTLQLLPLYLGGAYFTLREIVQIISLIYLKSFNIWLYDASNYLNVAFVVVVLFWAIRMDTGTGDKNYFRIGAAISVTALWLKLLAYLRNMLIDFAVFVGGVFYVVRRLAAFLTALCVILIAFAQMFYTIFQQSTYCTQQPNNDYTDELILDMTRCGANQGHAYCNFWTSFISVYTMLLGEVDESDFKQSNVAMVLFIFFMFLCVILLANVLIAIVTDSYKVIQDQRAAIVFWTNRLDFIAEMDAIANGPWKRRFLKEWIGFNSTNTTTRSGSSTGRRTEQVFGKELWNRCMELFEDEIDDGYMSLDFMLYTILRMIVAMLIIPLWLLVGIITLGWFWPPQVREAVFTSTVFKHSSDSVKEDELRKTQVKKLHDEVTELKDEILQELALDRTQIVQMKSQVAERKIEIGNEIKDIKKIVAMLFERQARFAP